MHHIPGFQGFYTVLTRSNKTFNEHLFWNIIRNEFHKTLFHMTMNVRFFLSRDGNTQTEKWVI